MSMRRHRHFVPITVAVTTIALSMGTFPVYANWAQKFHDGSALQADSDFGTKNAISRSDAQPGPETADPVSVKQAGENATSVEKQRAERDPKIVPVGQPSRSSVPQDRYAMAGGCYAFQSAATGLWVVRTGANYDATAESISDAEPIHFQASDLGTYLLYDSQSQFLSLRQAGAAEALDKPGTRNDWTVEMAGGTATFSLPAHGSALATDANGRLVGGESAGFKLRLTSGCATYPEVDVNVTGNPFGGVTPFQEVRGYVDTHTHGQAWEFLGGQVHCGRPWHPYGAPTALTDCPDHSLTGGNGAVLESFLKDGSPIGSHDPVGWPTFKDWPAPDSLTHEGTYYKWLERSWRAGQRVFVNLLVENNQLCMVYPLKRNSCDDMDSIRLQAKDMHLLERYIDAQNGGPGKGWYRIVTSPEEARKVINQGKLAVIMGVETSVPMGCSVKLDIPQCSTASIDAALDELYDLGVRQMELVNKFDNALSGVAGDGGEVGLVINGANFLETLSFWDMRMCEGDPEESDNPQVAAPTLDPQQDALFGAVAELFAPLPLKLPIYGSAPHCNARGLTTLGEYTIQGMAKRSMLFDPDHMSVKARTASLDEIDRLGYQGVLSSHSWSTPDAYARIYKQGGFVTPYAGDSDGFVKKWQRHLGWADKRYYFGFGYGADINGLGAQGDPRGADVPNKVTYPFTGLGGVTVDQQVSGERVYDINVDGVAHYGLYPDWIEDLRKQAGQDIVDDMARGSEAYLQTWERATGISNDACRDPKVIKKDKVFKNLKKGTSVQGVLTKAGQPHSRLGTKFTYCASKVFKVGPKGKKVKKTKKVNRTVIFSQSGKVVKVTEPKRI